MGECKSEGEAPGQAIEYLQDLDTGITARLAKKLLAWTPPGGGKLEVIRPGTFTAQYIRTTGLKTPVLIKGDRFNENPQLGLMWPDVHSVSVDILADYIGGERKVDTWDVVKQRPGPAWTLSQWCTYWHARQDVATRAAMPQTAAGGGPALGGIRGLGDDEDDDDGEVVDSGIVIVLQGAGATHSRYNPAPACVGISPEQAQRLLDGECLPLHGSQLTQHIHPPPAIQSVDLVRMVVRDHNKEKDAAAAGAPAAAGTAAVGGSVVKEGSTAAPVVVGAVGGAACREREQSEGGNSKAIGGKAASKDAVINLVTNITPADTLHLQMTPKDCFSDFRLAPGGAASWLYVLHGSKVVVLLPPTQANRRLFLTWAAATRAAQPRENVVVECFLAEYAEDAVKVEVKASQALVIPAGWFYATAAPSDTLAVGCFFWHPYALGDTARAQKMELQLRLKPPRFGLPGRLLLWFTALTYARQLRERCGLPAFQRTRVPGGASAHRSVSEASLNQQQQQRASPYLRGMRGPGAGGGRGAGLQGTPPMLGLPPPQQLEGSCGGVLGSPMVRHAAAAGKRQRHDMDHLYLGEAAVPLGHAAAGGQQQKRLKLVTGRPSPVTPNAAAGQQQGPTGAASNASTPRSNAQQQQNMFGTPAMPSSSNHSGLRSQQQHTRSLQRLRHNTPQAQQQQQQQRGGGYAAGRAGVMDDDDEGECHTSPVRRPEPGSADLEDPERGMDWGAGYVSGEPGRQQQQHLQRHVLQFPQQQQLQQQGQQRAGLVGAAAVAGSDAPRPITALKIKVPGRTQPMYSPVISGVHGDLDNIPPLSGQQQLAGAAVTPPAAVAAAAAGKQGGSMLDRLLPHAAVTPGSAAGAGTAGAGAATPSKKRIMLKGQGTPTAAAAAAAAAASKTPMAGSAGAATRVLGAAKPDAAAAGAAGAAGAIAATSSKEAGEQRGPSPDSSSAGSHAVSAALTNTSSGQQQQQQQQPAHVTSGRTQQQRKMVLPPVSDDDEEQEQQQQQQPQQQRQHVMPAAAPPPLPTPMQQQRRTSDGVAGSAAAAAAAAAAGPGVKAPNKIKFKMPSPSPKLATMPTPQAGPGVPPALSLDQPVQQQQQQQVIPQVDGSFDDDDSCCAMDLDCAVQQGQQAMQQLLQRQQQQQQQQSQLWGKWQQVQSALQQSRQQQWQQCNCGSSSIPQVDGTGDEGRPITSGPTLVLQPSPTPPMAAAQQQQQQQGGSNPKSPQKGSHLQQQQQQQQVVGVVALPGAVGGFLSPGRSNLATAVSVTAAAAANGGVRSTPPPHDTLLPLHMLPPISSARPPMAKQQQQHVQTAAAAGASTAAAQQQAAVPAILKNPTVQPQVQKLRLAAAAAAASSPSNSPSPRPHSPLAEDISVAASGALPSIQQQQQQQQQAADGAVPAGLLAIMSGDSGVAAAAAATAAAGEKASEEVGHVESLRVGLPDAPSFTCWAGQTAEEAAEAAAVAGQDPAGTAVGVNTAAGDSVACSRSGSAALPSPVGAVALGGALGSSAVAAPGIPAGGITANAVISRRPSAMGDSVIPDNPLTAAVAAAVPAKAAGAVSTPPPQQQQQQQPMLPPPPTKLTSWELRELPMLVELLQEQAVDKAIDIPHGNGNNDDFRDPEFLLQQLLEAVNEAQKREGTGLAATIAAGGQAAAASQQQVQAAEEPAVAADRWFNLCGPLFVSPLAQRDMPAGLAEHLRSAAALLRSSGAGTGVTTGPNGELLDPATTEVVAETDPNPGEHSAGGGSYDNRSFGSVGGSRGAAAAAGPAGGAGVGRAGVGRGEAAAAAGVGGATRHPVKRNASSAQMQPVGVQQARNIKKQQVRKGLGLGR